MKGEGEEENEGDNEGDDGGDDPEDEDEDEDEDGKESPIKVFSFATFCGSEEEEEEEEEDDETFEVEMDLIVEKRDSFLKKAFS